VNALDAVAGALLVIGAAFILLGGVGALRFHGTFSRMHAAAKGPALGVIGLASGTALSIRTTEAVVTVILVVVLQLTAIPVSAHLLGRSIYRQVDRPVDGLDELADALERERDESANETP
jgi:multicomponent Na+:H+ antiporter subunit G